jgi:hypothetical protein
MTSLTDDLWHPAKSRHIRRLTCAQVARGYAAFASDREGGRVLR